MRRRRGQAGMLGGMLLAAVTLAPAESSAGCPDGEVRECTTDDGCPGISICSYPSWGTCMQTVDCHPDPEEPFGALNAVNITATGADVEIYGWAIDPSTLQSPIQVRVTVDNLLQGTYLANVYRSDIALSHPSAGGYHGFYVVLPAGLWGKHQVCVTALNVGSGINTSLGCRSYELEGKVTETWGLEDVTRCVEDPIQAVNALGISADLGFFLNAGSHSEGLGFNLSSPHLQGVQRLAFGDGRHLVVSRSGSFEFYVVEMGSQLSSGDPFTSALSLGDLVVHREPNDADAGFEHAGGIQALGTLLAVPNHNSDNVDDTRVDFYDVSVPSSPAHIGFLGRNDCTSCQDLLASDQAGAVGLVRLSDDRILMAVGRDESNQIDFYLSDPGGPTGWMHVDLWDESERKTDLPDGDKEFGDYQSLNFVTRCDGALFLVGTHQEGDLFGGSDWVDLFRVRRWSEAIITKVAKRNVTCSGECNLDASGGRTRSRSMRFFAGSSSPATCLTAT